jgi:hypothetical protein
VDPSNAAWRTSSYSGGNGGQCVEVAAITRPDSEPAQMCAVRDSKNPRGTVLAFTPQQWRRFTATMKTGNSGVT